MDTKSELDCYLYFMWNVWSKDICLTLFDGDLGEHLWHKWRGCVCCYGHYAAPSVYYSDLDEGRRKTLREAAFRHYNKEG